MSIDMRKNNEMSELILHSLKKKKIDIKEVNDIKAYFDTVTKVIKYTAISREQIVKGEIFI